MRPHGFGVRARGVSGCHDRARLGSQRRALLVLRWTGCYRLRGQAEAMAVLFEPVFQETDGSQEVMALQHHQVDVVRVPAAAEAVCQVVFWIDRRLQSEALRTYFARDQSWVGG